MEKKVADLEKIIESQDQQIASLMQEVFQLREQVRDLEYIYDED